MNVAKIKPCDIADGPGVRVSVFVSGCRRHCHGCQNAEAWDFGFGEPYTEQTKEYILKLLEPDYIDGITILGGEPFEQENIPGVAEIVQIAEESGKSIWIYSGYTLEQLVNRAKTEREIWYILDTADVLVDGEYREDERDITLKYRGSRNQRVIETTATFVEYWKTGKMKPVIWEGEE
ncbi:MAG: anaerobic ribonucleoside-triphosphate reductase activating protein [Clostridia bacterium]|nr:anaerobic ribonucleoside-triphosphate reductase activating protein [Clostridia bacterium]